MLLISHFRSLVCVCACACVLPSSYSLIMQVHQLGMLHHQQVTSSTHPQTIGADGMNTNLRGLLSHHNPHGMYTAASGQVIRVNLSGQPQQMNNVVTYRSTPGVQQYPVSLAPPSMSRYSNPHPSQHPAQHGNQLSGPSHQQQQLYQLQQQQQQARISPHAVMFNNPGMRPALHARVQSPQSSNQQSQPLAPPMHQGGGVQWHIPQQSAGMVNGTGLPLNSSSQHHSASRPPPLPLPVDESFKITLKHVPQQQQQIVQRAAPAPAPSTVVDAGNKMPGGHVTSSVPKTPSPSQARVEDPEKSLDKFCQVKLKIGRKVILASSVLYFYFFVYNFLSWSVVQHAISTV